MKWLLMLLAAVAFGVGTLPVLYFWTTRGLFCALDHMGGFAAGAWALAAGLLAIYAARAISDGERENRRREVAATCLVELTGFWNYMEGRNILGRLADSVAALDRLHKNPAPTGVHGASNLSIATYKGHVGQSWLSLQTTSPEVFGALPLDLAQAVADYYSEVRNVYGRLNWLHGCSFSVTQIPEALREEGEIKKDFDDLKVRYPRLATQLHELIRRTTKRTG